MSTPVVQETPHLARKAQARQITRRKGKYVGTEKREKDMTVTESQAFFSWNSPNVRKEVRLMKRETINPAYETKQLTIPSL